MTKLGYLLLIAGFLGGAYATSLDIDAVSWALFAPAAAVAAAGLLIIKKTERGAAQAEHVLDANRAILESSLAKLINDVEAMSAQRRTEEALSTDALRGEIDARLREDLRQFVEARESLVHLYGIQAYADVMSEFAAGERHINRVWSASTDGYGDEADRYLEQAARRFKSAQERLSAFADAA